MAKVTISLNGRPYSVACDEGQEARVLELGSYIDRTMRQIARNGAASSEAHLLVLTAIVLADEMINAKENAKSGKGLSPEQERINVAAVEHLTKRIETLTSKIKALA